MFQKRTGHLAAILIGLSFCAQPITSFANDGAAPDVVPQATYSPGFKEDKSSLIADISFEDFQFDVLRQDAKVKIGETQDWVKDKTPVEAIAGSIQTLEIKVDRLQDQVKPAGRSIKATIKNKFPGKGLIQLGDRKVSVYGLMLMMAFGIVLFLMSAANPASRLGGRH